MVDDVLFMLEQMALLLVGVEVFVVGLIAGVRFMSVGIVAVMGWRGCVALLVVDVLSMVELVMVAVGR